MHMMIFSINLIFSKYRIGLGIIIASLIAISACTPLPKHSTPTVTPTAPAVSILDNPGLNHFKSALAEVIKEYATTPNPVNHFYISKYPADSTITYMLWKEGRKFWIMSLGNEDEYSWRGVLYPSGGQLLDLDTDVVATQDEVGSSTYLVPQDWINERVYDAVVNGDLIVITTK